MSTKIALETAFKRKRMLIMESHDMNPQQKSLQLTLSKGGPTELLPPRYLQSYDTKLREQTQGALSFFKAFSRELIEKHRRDRRGSVSF